MAPDLFAALQDLRKKTLEPLGSIPLCNGARVDCYPSGMARDMGGGQVVYVLPARRWLRGKLSFFLSFSLSLSRRLTWPWSALPTDQRFLDEALQLGSNNE